VDDFLICFHSKSVVAIERQLQRCINSIQKWADENGFQFSNSKTVGMHFSNQNSVHEYLILNFVVLLHLLLLKQSFWE
jgi:Reverse transcriptase (RNA-dependent DNA polymerase)